MSYHVTILRTKRREQLPITRAEADALVAARPELEARPAGDGTLEITVRAKGDASPLLTWQDGEIWTGNPDDDTLRLMLDLAASLGARVRGDELETYRAVDDSYVHPDDRAAVAESGRRMRAIARRNAILSWLAPFVVFALLGLMVHRCSGR